MRRALICTGILGGGTAMTFAAAALAAALFPSGNLVYGNQAEMFLAKPMDRGFVVAPPPFEVPAMADGGIAVPDAPKGR